MLNDDIRSEIRSRVFSLIAEFDHEVAGDKIRNEYAADPEQLHYALWFHQKQRAEQSQIMSSNEEERVWRRIYKDDETTAFREIEPLKIEKSFARFFKVRSPRSDQTMLI